MTKTNKLLILVTLLFVLVGAASASEISDDTVAVDTQDAYDTITQVPAPATTSVHESVTGNIKDKIEIQKEDKNTKTLSKTVDVNDFNTFHEILTSDSYDSLTVNINSNIKLTNNTTLNPLIKTLTINGNQKTINGDNKYRFLIIPAYSNVNINDISIINCRAKYGGAIENTGTLTIANSSLNNNTAELFGGAIYSYSKNLTVAGCSLNDNTAKNNGGAIYNYNSTLTITNSQLNNNSVGQYYNRTLYRCMGGAVYNYEGNLTIVNSTLNNNTSLHNNTATNLESLGGAIYLYNCTLTILNSTINNNSAAIGGAIYNNYDSFMIIKNSTLNNNTAKGIIYYDGYEEYVYQADGGGIYNNPKGVLNITNTGFSNNHAGDDGGAIVNAGYLTITNCNFNNNCAFRGGAIHNYANTLTINNTTLIDNNAELSGGAIHSSGTDTINITDNCFITNQASQAAAIYREYTEEYTAIINNNLFIKNKANMTGKAIIDSGNNTTIKNNINDEISIYHSTIYNRGNNIVITNNTFDDRIIYTKTMTYTSYGTIGQKLTIKATVTDTNNNKINEGNLIFKLNGVTIKDNGKLRGSNNPLKVKVTNGIAAATITPDTDMRNSDKLTAHYIGTTNYNASASSPVKIQIAQRNASIVVTSNVKTIKQGQVLTLTAKVYDITNGKKSGNLTAYNGQFVYFKVNGITLKDSKGNMLKVKIVNGVASANYTIPLGLSCVTDGKTMTPKNHTILAGFYNKNYQENIRNTSYFQVERSNITITITNATVNNNTHKLSLTATIKDYLGNIVAGPNKCVIKINGVSLKNGSQPMYYYSTNGILNIKNITIPSYNKYASIEIVTQDRLAYKSQRNTTTVIKVTN